MDTRLKVATISTVVAMVIAAAAVSISPVGASHYGWGGSDDFTASNDVEMKYESKNQASVVNNTNQTAVTGEVDLMHNDDHDGAAGTGAASNEAETGTDGSLSNTPVAMGPPPAPSLGDVSALEEWDDVELKNKVETSVKSENKVEVINNTNQTAVSGSIDIHCNDDVTGDVTTGDASNSSSTTTTLTLSN